MNVPVHGSPILHQRWENLLFIHWPVTPDRIRELVPGDLEVDTYDGSAWVTMTPFWAVRTRPHGIPAIPLVGDSHEVNVRTYVRRDGITGIWFLSIDASNPLAVVGARLGFSLPYHLAWMRFVESADAFRFQSTRIHPGAPAATLDARWARGAALPPAEPGSIEFFLAERYCLYTMRFGRLCRACIVHAPWPLHAAEVESLSSTLLEALALDVWPDGRLTYAQGAALDVDIWGLESM